MRRLRKVCRSKKFNKRFPSPLRADEYLCSSRMLPRRFIECTINFNTHRRMRVFSVQTTDRSCRNDRKFTTILPADVFSGFHIKFVSSF